jgi:hypothetical protein
MLRGFDDLRNIESGKQPIGKRAKPQLRPERTFRDAARLGCIDDDLVVLGFQFGLEEFTLVQYDEATGKPIYSRYSVIRPSKPTRPRLLA